MHRSAISLFVLLAIVIGCSQPPSTVLSTTNQANPIPNPTEPQIAPTQDAIADEVNTAVPTPTLAPTFTPTDIPTPTPVPLNPLQIEYLRERDFPGSNVTIEQTLDPGSNYNRYLASYESDGLKIYALLTIPRGTKPKTGWPVVIFNHGFIPPATYRTTERYVAYVDALARSGYIVFKSDYRGHGSSEGNAAGGYGSPDYTIDVLNAIASVKRLPDVDINRIGMWGHSMGGQVTLRAMVTSPDIKAGVIWAGVVGSYSDLISKWHARPGPTPLPSGGTSRRWRQNLIEQYGTPEENPKFWNSISPNSYLADISGPLQLDHDVNDGEVPYQFSKDLFAQLQQAGKTAEFYSYPGNDHNIAQSFSLAMQRTITFFDKYVKGANTDS